jgi:hypothetical protein
MKTPVKISMIVGLTALPIVAVAIYGVAQRSAAEAPQAAAGHYKEIDWRILRDLDYQTGQKTPDLAALDGTYVKIPGFVVPLDDDASSYSEFLLVPSPQACIHVPPPPPNQMIMVRMAAGQAPQRSWGPVWIKGRINIATMDSQYGKISYMVRGDTSEPYKMPEDDAPPMPPDAGGTPPSGGAGAAP